MNVVYIEDTKLISTSHIEQEKLHSKSHSTMVTHREEIKEPRETENVVLTGSR